MAAARRASPKASGGTYWRKKDRGAWSIPKGEIDMSGDTEQAARREFAEELGPAALIGPLRVLGEIRQRGGKRVIAFCEKQISTQHRRSAIPSRSSGRIAAHPEIDRAAWFDLGTARSKILSAQTEHSIDWKRACHEGMPRQRFRDRHSLANCRIHPPSGSGGRKRRV
jgi:predicted NUDIX family NTP pyrophosphohydrolase